MTFSVSIQNMYRIGQREITSKQRKLLSTFGGCDPENRLIRRIYLRWADVHPKNVTLPSVEESPPLQCGC